jgi:hypothetical protein
MRIDTKIIDAAETNHKVHPLPGPRHLPSNLLFKIFEGEIIFHNSSKGGFMSIHAKCLHARIIYVVMRW